MYRCMKNYHFFCRMCNLKKSKKTLSLVSLMLNSCALLQITRAWTLLPLWRTYCSTGEDGGKTKHWFPTRKWSWLPLWCVVISPCCWPLEISSCLRNTRSQCQSTLQAHSAQRERPRRVRLDSLITAADFQPGWLILLICHTGKQQYGWFSWWWGEKARRRSGVINAPAHSSWRVTWMRARCTQLMPHALIQLCIHRPLHINNWLLHIYKSFSKAGMIFIYFFMYLLVLFLLNQAGGHA